MWAGPVAMVIATSCCFTLRSVQLSFTDPLLTWLLECICAPTFTHKTAESPPSTLAAFCRGAAEDPSCVRSAEAGPSSERRSRPAPSCVAGACRAEVNLLWCRRNEGAVSQRAAACHQQPPGDGRSARREGGRERSWKHRPSPGSLTGLPLELQSAVST